MYTIIDIVWPDGNDSNVELSELNFIIGSKPTADTFIKKKINTQHCHSLTQKDYPD